MNTLAIYKDLMDRYGDYEEGTEVGDAMGSMITAARVLAGIAEYSMACKILLLVRDLVEHDLEWRVSEEGIDSLSDKEKLLFRTGC